MRGAFPGKRFVISTVTATGNKIARGISREGDYVTYLPLDFSFVIRKSIERIKPSLFIIAETEIWPNLITCLYNKKIPIVVVNGRLSDSSFRGYRCIRLLLKPILNKVSIFCVQTARDDQRLTRLGVLEEKIKITGNMKFDLNDYTDLKIDYTDYKSRLGLGSGEQLFIAASTHPGEEEIILKVYKDLLREFANLRLLIAPRHPERSQEIERIIIRQGFDARKVSQLANRATDQLTSRLTGQPAGRPSVFILDSVGQLINYYAICDIVFVGGSLVEKGGHNILEPASLGKPILFGPHMFNFHDIAELFLRNNAAVSVHNQKELGEKLRWLLDSPPQMSALGQRAQGLISDNRGATTRNLEYIKTFLNLNSKLF
jgi:3-deoxy-D-manno-octulosonic-acid transferase